MMWGNTVYCVELSAEGLSRYANEIELFASRKCPYIAIDITITNISQSLPYVVAGNSWHRYGMKKYVSCHPMYKYVVL